MSELIEAVHAANEELFAFQMRWDIDGDYIRCRKCKQPQLSTYANEAFMHAEKCRNDPVREVNPWITYLTLLAPIAAHLNVAAWNHRHSGGDGEADSLRVIAKRNLRRLIEIGSTETKTMLSCLEELS